MKHVLESQQFTKEDLEKLFALATSLEGKRTKDLDGKIMASLFYEPSTRTRLSFESAMERLGGNVISTENAREFSSAAKGETLEDTIRMVHHYADAIVLRHYEQGASVRASVVSEVPIINAGDGAGQHPTQGLLDLYTIFREIGKIDGIRVAAVGDLKNGRTIRSLSYLLGKYDNVSLSFVAPKALAIGSDIKDYLDKHNVSYEETEGLESVLETADVIYMTRIQKERFADSDEYAQLKGSYIFTRAHADRMKEGAIIMHPLPRVDEITTDVDDSPHAAYFKEAKYGVLVRMALLKTLLG